MRRPSHHKQVRKIGVTYRSVSGKFPEFGEFESTLERDFMELCRFDDSILKVVPQPIEITFESKSGRKGIYTPDGLVVFKEELVQSPILYEIKYIEDFRKDWKIIMPKLRAAKEYAQSQSWVFEVFTEKAIRTTYLENIKFLWRFKNRVPPKEFIQHIQEVMLDLGQCDPEFLLHVLFKTPEKRAQMIPVMWHMVANKLIGCDLDKPLSMLTPIWPIGIQHEDN